MTQIYSQKISKERLKDNFKIGKHQDVTVTETPVSIQTKATTHRPTDCPIIKLDATHYQLKKTKEIKEFNRTEKRTDNIVSLARSMNRLRNIINANVTDISKVTWLTLTYQNNMQDEAVLYDDFRKFNMRLHYYCNKNCMPHYEYICVVEYQARGALHCHVLLIWSDTAPFIPNDTMAQIWGHGFSKTKALHGKIENIANYVCAYLTDLPLADAIKARTDLSKHDIKTTKDGKRYVKASRLHLYPPNCKLYRTSKGIKQPNTYKISAYELEKKLDEMNAHLTHENYVYIYEDSKRYNSFGTLVRYQNYDLTPTARQIQQMIKSYRISHQYRLIQTEYNQIMLECSMMQDYFDCIPIHHT